MGEKGTATENTVADDELSHAYDSIGSKDTKEEVKEPEKEVSDESEGEEKTPEKASSEPKPEEDEDHKEASKLGRKVKGLYDRFDQIMARLDQIQQPARQEVKEVDMPEVITSPEDVERVLSAREERAKQAKVSYERSYLKVIGELAGDNEELHEEIYTEMMKNHNVRHSDNPDMDARLNYERAKFSVATRKSDSDKPKRIKSDKIPAQPAAGAARSESKSVAMPKLDKEAQDYVNYLRKKGTSEDDIAKILE